MNENNPTLERRRPGPTGIEPKAVFEAADRIWQGGQGPVPTIQGVRAVLGTGSTRKLSDLMENWRATRLGVPAAPAIPVSLAKAINDHYASMRKDITDDFKKLLDATKQDNETLQNDLADAETQLEKLEAAHLHARAKKDELVGVIRQQSENTRQLQIQLAAANQANVKLQVATAQAQAELEIHLGRMGSTEMELEITKRAHREAQKNLEAVNLELAALRERLAGAMVRLSDCPKQLDSSHAVVLAALPREQHDGQQH